jgi:uncharacterized membrane protein
MNKKRVEKRKEEYERKSKSQKKIIAGIIIVILLSTGIFYIATSVDLELDNNVSETTVESDDTIRVPLAGISKNAKFHIYDSDGVEISFFTVFGEDGEVHVALNACDLCYHAKQGYEQTSDVMRCINCGLTYPINSIGTENIAGGCWPSYIPITIEGEDVIINTQHLDAKRYMFS